jgi:dTDP-glucose 4,6-dehydratase
VSELSTKQTLVISGGAEFIGSAFVRWAAGSGRKVIVLDALTYAGRMENLAPVVDKPNCVFIKGDICNTTTVRNIFQQHKLDAVFHFAAESHVDQSIENPGIFIKTNVLGTQTLLDAVLEHFERLWSKAQKSFRFFHISTDEVFGSLGSEGYFNEDTPYAPRSPYSASKAASDHLVRAWEETYGLPASIVNCTNNYGPYQLPEKFIPA